MIRDEDGEPLRFSGAAVEITERKRAEETQRLLMHELAHRVRNTLAVVQALTTQTLRSSTSVADATEKLQSRIAALSRAHDMLMQSDWLSATMRDVVAATAVNTGMEDGDRIRVSGPDISLVPQVALSFGLVLHELLTNAVKYGSLSSDSGHVEVSWSVDMAEGTNVFGFTWREVGGPPVSSPERSGFGSKLVRSTLGALGSIDIDYDPSGLVVEFSAPLQKIETQSTDI